MNIRIVLLCLLLVIPTTVAWAGTHRPDLAGLEARGLGPRAAVRPLSEWMGDDAGIIVFIDARSARHQAFLNTLVREGYPGYRTTIVLLDSGNGRAVSGIDLSPWAEAKVVRADVASARRTLASGALPAVLGTDAEGEVVWRRTGDPSRTDMLVRQMLEWLQ